MDFVRDVLGQVRRSGFQRVSNLSEVPNTERLSRSQILINGG